MRKPTFTEVKPLPTGVAIGPLSPILLRLMESSNSSGRVWPNLSSACWPAMCSSHSICTREASMMRTTADATSGPMPSPGISVIRCIKLNPYFVLGALYFGAMVVKSQRTKHKVQSTLPKVNKISKLRLADIIIVGGGVIGLTIARALAKRGAGDVVLIEKDQPGLEASWAAGGILGPQAEADQTDDFFRLGCASRDLYPSFADSLKEETGMDVELDKTGTLYLGFTADDE
ncbi:MAG: hypothetical protein DMF76_15260, partial [Acidobacteria bacterium]